ncbi:unnamed protein product [Notodromas monacha]|uniref:Uncharacterized protein n=1 Tax=Notodromas monacha TaxID=399045 RepID=A0A7R9GGX1_9CRUS|nr:unnamed protein product [Notodromas monacha]CAG0920865.1 unnamed protein product [Notodromas monacha]
MGKLLELCLMVLLLASSGSSEEVTAPGGGSNVAAGGLVSHPPDMTTLPPSAAMVSSPSASGSHSGNIIPSGGLPGISAAQGPSSSSASLGSSAGGLMSAGGSPVGLSGKISPKLPPRNLSGSSSAGAFLSDRRPSSSGIMGSSASGSGDVSTNSSIASAISSGSAAVLGSAGPAASSAPSSGLNAPSDIGLHLAGTAGDHSIANKTDAAQTTLVPAPGAGLTTGNAAANANINAAAGQSSNNNNPASSAAPASAGLLQRCPSVAQNFEKISGLCHKSVNLGAKQLLFKDGYRRRYTSFTPSAPEYDTGHDNWGPLPNKLQEALIFVLDQSIHPGARSSLTDLLVQRLKFDIDSFIDNHVRTLLLQNEKIAAMNRLKTKVIGEEFDPGNYEFADDPINPSRIQESKPSKKHHVGSSTEKRPTILLLSTKYNHQDISTESPESQAAAEKVVKRLEKLNDGTNTESSSNAKILLRVQCGKSGILKRQNQEVRPNKEIPKKRTADNNPKSSNSKSASNKECKLTSFSRNEKFQNNGIQPQSSSKTHLQIDIAQNSNQTTTKKTLANFVESSTQDVKWEELTQN